MEEVSVRLRNWQKSRISQRQRRGKIFEDDSETSVSGSVHGQAGDVLMINRIAYDYYLQAEESLRQREMEEAKRKEQEEKMSPEILEMIRTGDEYIRTIREANDDIPGEVISEKLDRLEQVVRRIFEVK